MTDLAAKYEFPAEAMEFVRSSFPEVISEDEARKTIEFRVPSKRRTDDEGQITSYSAVWIYPAFNAEFCHSYDWEADDLPNFYAVRDTTEIGDEPVADLDAVDAMAGYLKTVSAPAFNSQRS